MRSDHDFLIEKLDAFIRKYYKDRAIRGLLYSSGLVVAMFLAAALLEHIGRFGTTMRSLLFWATALGMLAVLVRYIAIPLVKLFRLGPVISHAQAARIIGDHFASVKDKLLNTLQLREMAAGAASNRELIEAAIAQRSRELRPIPFTNAIDLRRNTRYLRFALPPIAVLAVLLLAAPSTITGPTQRLLRHGTEFLPEAPFRYVLLSDPLEVPEEEDFDLLLELQGQVVPQLVELVTAEGRTPLVRKEGGRLGHRFRNVKADTRFRLVAEGYWSPEYELRVTPSPLLLDFSLHMHYPAYLGMPESTQENTGDVTVPAGTRITWSVNARSSDRLELAFDDTTFRLAPTGPSLRGPAYRAERRFLLSTTYRMTPLLGAKAPPGGSLPYRVEVVPDLYPTIQMESHTDSSALKRLFFRGTIADDHGLRRLVFHYRFVNGGDSIPPGRRSGSVELRIDPRTVRQEFFHAWDLYDLTLSPGDRIEHWFEVWDNDGVNGSKSTRSTVSVFAAPTLRELAEREGQRNEEIRRGMQESIREAQEIRRDLERLQRDLLDRKEMNWGDRQRLENALERQRALQERIERNTEQLRRSHQEQRVFREVDERLLDKQQRLQELFQNILSEEMKELYRQVQEMLEQLDKEQIQEQMKEMTLSQEDIEKELDRALELFKRMEVEQLANDLARRMDELAERQRNLSERTQEQSSPQEELMREQERLNEEFDALRQELDSLERKNSELETPMDLPETGPLEESIQQDQRNSMDQLGKKQNQKAGGSQKSAADKMEQLAHQLEAAVSASEQEQQEEDMDALRQLLENILHLSFEQEAVMNEVSATHVRDPRFIQQGRRQRRLRDDAKVVEDSLFALSKRVPQIQSVVNREMNAVNANMDEALALLGESRANERNKPMATDRQQQAMTGLNNLALLLDEALQQMMNAMMQSGGGACSKPGKPKPGQGNGACMAKMKSQQQALQKQLEEMRKALEQGRKPGEKPGQRNEGSSGMPGMSRQLAQLAAQQAAIRKEMQRLAQELNKDGSGAGNELNKLAEQMERQEKDIVNRNITPETLRRQQDIMTRLLEHERAERERELDQERRSQEGRDQPPPDPARFFERLRSRARETDLLRTLPPGLRPYYRDRVSSYFGTFDRP
jgi:hypothetical protein